MANSLALISAWEQDPGNGSHPDGGTLIQRPVPNLGAQPFPTAIQGHAPPADNYQPGTPQFRYWACADALRRASDFWGLELGKHKWNPAIGAGPLPVKLDEGLDLNAYYDRQALNFFHAPVSGRTVYSGESPDVVCHEFGHAVLDSIRPQLWDVSSFEPPAFHESFGDISALLTALQVQSVRIAVLQETGNAVYRSSRLSRLAEQLGWAIRQKAPSAVDHDCLRDAVNSLFYHNPDDLPTTAPASALSSEPHSLSRVFTAAFLQSLALMYTSASAGHASETVLEDVSKVAGKVLLTAIRQSPIVPEYFSQLGAHMVAIAGKQSDTYGAAVRTAMVGHGILSVTGIAAVAMSPESAKLDMNALGVASAPAELSQRAIDVSQFGIKSKVVHMFVASEPKRYGIAGAARSTGDTASQSDEHSATVFFEDLIRRGRLDDGGYAIAGISDPSEVKTHILRKEGDKVVLRRLRIDCGLRASESKTP